MQRAMSSSYVYPADIYAAEPISRADLRARQLAQREALGEEEAGCERLQRR